MSFQDESTSPSSSSILVGTLPGEACGVSWLAAVHCYLATRWANNEWPYQLQFQKDIFICNSLEMSS